MRHGCSALLLLVATMAASASEPTGYISPAGSNLFVIEGTAPGEIYHGSTDQVTGTVSAAAGHAQVRFQADLTALLRAEGSPTRRFDRVLDPASRPELSVFIDSVDAWPAEMPEDTLSVRGWGHVELGGAAAPVTTQLTLCCSRRDETGALTGYSIRLLLPLRPVDLGIDVPDWATPLLKELSTRWVAHVRPDPHLPVSGSYNWVRGEAFTRGQELGYGAVGEGFFVRAALNDEDVLELLDGMGISVSDVADRIDDRLEATRPDSAGRLRWSPGSGELVHRAAHAMAYRLGAAQVEPVHLLLAVTGTHEHWSRQLLADAGITHAALLAQLVPRPPEARSVRRIGNPFHPDRPDSVALRYARNVWDMHLWDGRIYLGHGNSSNVGPAVNAGPVDVISYDPVRDRFTTEFRGDDEQIDKYRVIDGHLLIPGHDPRDPWDLGNHYVLADTGWTKVRTIPGGIHTYGMRGFRDSLFAALGTTMGGVVARSGDGGQTWESVGARSVIRVFELFVLRDELYGYGYRPEGKLLRYSGDAFVPLWVDPFAGVSHTPNAMVVRTVRFGQELLYIGADNVNDHQWTPFAAYHAARIDEPQRINLPDGFLPYDILVRGSKAWLLANRPNGEDDGYQTAIYGAEEPTTWSEIVRVSLPAFARSFERWEDRFILGLGTGTSPLSEASGDLYEVVPP